MRECKRCEHLAVCQSTGFSGEKLRLFMHMCVLFKSKNEYTATLGSVYKNKIQSKGIDLSQAYDILKKSAPNCPYCVSLSQKNRRIAL